MAGDEGLLDDGLGAALFVDGAAVAEPDAVADDDEAGGDLGQGSADDAKP